MGTSLIMLYLRNKYTKDYICHTSVIAGLVKKHNRPANDIFEA